MPRNKFLVLLAGALLLCALTFTGFSAPSAFAASATTATHNTVAAPAYTCPLPVVGYGYTESGSAVLLAQQSLNWWYNNNSSFRAWVKGNFPGDLPIAQDSYFGNQTWNATWDFQYWHGGLSHDGIIGPQTWHALGHC
jgi:peptidoglycan hydrolase-like protein with peptidoglycan-binding domain